MASTRSAEEYLVVRDSRPWQAIVVGFPLALVVRLALAGSFIWAIVPLVGAAGMIATFGSQRHHTVAIGAGISGLYFRPDDGDAFLGFRRRTFVEGITPWSQIDSISVRSSIPWGTELRVRLVDGREAKVDVKSVSRRWLDSMAASLNRLRSHAA